MLVSSVACPENAGVKCVCHNRRDVCRVNGALGRVVSVVPAYVGVVEWVAGGLGVDGQSVGVVLVLPLLDEGMYSIDQAVLWDRIEEAHEIVVGGVYSVEGCRVVCRSGSSGNGTTIVEWIVGLDVEGGAGEG